MKSKLPLFHVKLHYIINAHHYRCFKGGVDCFFSLYDSGFVRVLEILENA